MKRESRLDQQNRETPAPERMENGSGPLKLMSQGEFLAALRLLVSKGSGAAWRWGFLAVAGLVFLFSGGIYITDTIRYSGVSAWPSVEARILGQTGSQSSITTMGRWGRSSITVDTREVQFEYAVNGKTITGHRGSPDCAGLPSNPWGRPWRAYYKPASPEIAVLEPSPYEGSMPLLAAMFSGVFVACPLYCAFRDRTSLRKK